MFEQRFMSAACRRSDEFQVSRVLGQGDFGMVALVTCTTPGFMWPTKQYALKVCFNFDLDTDQARNAYINEFIELVKLPSHPNIIRFLCEFVDEIHDNIRPHLPDFARASHQDSSRRHSNQQKDSVLRVGARRNESQAIVGIEVRTTIDRSSSNGGDDHLSSWIRSPTP